MPPGGLPNSGNSISGGSTTTMKRREQRRQTQRRDRLPSLSTADDLTTIGLGAPQCGQQTRGTKTSGASAQFTSRLQSCPPRAASPASAVSQYEPVALARGLNSPLAGTADLADQALAPALGRCGVACHLLKRPAGLGSHRAFFTTRTAVARPPANWTRPAASSVRSAARAFTFSLAVNSRPRNRARS